MDDIKVSCIIPVYNAEKYLEDFIEGIKGQTFKSVEYIFVDDCSTDNSFEIINSSKIENLRIIKNPENFGAAKSRNLALNFASGKYVIYLDCDDLVSKNLIEKAFLLCENEKADVCVFYSGDIDNSTGKLTAQNRRGKNITNIKTYPILYPSNEREELFYLITNAPFDKMVRRDLLVKEKIHFQDIPKTEDMLYSFSCIIKAKKVVFCDEVLHFYRTGEGIHNLDYPQGVVEALNEIFIENTEFVVTRNYWDFVVERTYISLQKMSEDNRKILSTALLRMLEENGIEGAVLGNLAYGILDRIKNDDYGKKYDEIHFEYMCKRLNECHSFLACINSIFLKLLYKKGLYSNFIVSKQAYTIEQIVNAFMSYIKNKKNNIFGYKV